MEPNSQPLCVHRVSFESFTGAGRGLALSDCRRVVTRPPPSVCPWPAGCPRSWSSAIWGWSSATRCAVTSTCQHARARLPRCASAPFTAQRSDTPRDCHGNPGHAVPWPADGDAAEHADGGGRSASGVACRGSHQRLQQRRPQQGRTHARWPERTHACRHARSLPHTLATRKRTDEIISCPTSERDRTHQVKWSSASRTDKGVHAAACLCSKWPFG